ncbi:Fis family transcriptional regulator, partial [Vibrio parahaemolyticus]|uniref:sigma 54-interacting transcriptional regulator n=1 Tax=Vibrio parahaemolyticus TaxID=670 RepID=UPI00062B16CA
MLFGVPGSRVARSACIFLISDAGDTGKEAVARAIHKVSSRSHKPIMSINCRALNEQRFQAEDFGIAADAEMGPSLLDQADGGTVLFNDILTISQDQQMNPLRFLQ